MDALEEILLKLSCRNLQGLAKNLDLTRYSHLKKIELVNYILKNRSQEQIKKKIKFSFFLRVKLAFKKNHYVIHYTCIVTAAVLGWFFKNTIIAYFTNETNPYVISQEVISTKKNPFYCRVNPWTQEVFVLNASANYLTIYNPISKATRSLELSFYPHDIDWLNEYECFIASAADSAVYFYSLKEAKVLKKYANSDSIKYFVQPDEIKVNIKMKEVYVPDYGGDFLTIINYGNGSIRTIKVGEQATGVAVDLRTNKIYVSNLVPEYDTNKNYKSFITVIERDSKKRIYGTPREGAGLAIDTVNNFLYVVGSKDEFVSKIDIDNNQLRTNIPLVSSDAVSIELSPNGNFMVVGNLSYHTIIIYDLVKEKTVTALSIPSLYKDFFGLCVDWKNNIVYTTSRMNDKLILFRLKSSVFS